MSNEEIVNIPLLSHQFQDETDRGVAIVGAARLDALLEQIIANFLVEDSKAMELAENLSFNQKIRAAYCMGLISKDEFDDLDHVRQIRNRFAHNRGINSFLHEDISQECNQLSFSKKWVERSDVDPRYLFSIAIVLLLKRLELRLSYAERDRRSVPSEIAPKDVL